MRGGGRWWPGRPPETEEEEEVEEDTEGGRGGRGRRGRERPAEAEVGVEEVEEERPAGGVEEGREMDSPDRGGDGDGCTCNPCEKKREEKEEGGEEEEEEEEEEEWEEPGVAWTAGGGDRGRRRGGGSRRTRRLPGCCWSSSDSDSSSPVSTPACGLLLPSSSPRSPSARLPSSPSLSSSPSLAALQGDVDDEAEAEAEARRLTDGLAAAAAAAAAAADRSIAAAHVQCRSGRHGDGMRRSSTSRTCRWSRELRGTSPTPRSSELWMRSPHHTVSLTLSDLSLLSILPTTPSHTSSSLVSPHATRARSALRTALLLRILWGFLRLFPLWQSLPCQCPLALLRSSWMALQL